MKYARLTLLVGAALVATGCSSGAPQAVAPETSYDFGDVPVVTDMVRGAKYKEFVIRNDGTKDLKLSNIQVKLLEGC